MFYNYNLPLQAATIRHVLLLSLAILTFAPCSIKYLTIFKCPKLHAARNGVDPVEVRQSTVAPLSTRTFTTSK